MMPTKSYVTLSGTAATGRNEPRVNYINKYTIRGIAEIKSRKKERRSKPDCLVVLFSTTFNIRVSYLLVDK
jgi:hypothetical protein